MSGYPERHADVGKLTDLGRRELTVAAVPVSAQSRPIVAVSIQNTEVQGNNVLVGDATYQSFIVAGGNTYTVRAADANQVYMRAEAGTVVAAIHILEP